MKKLLLVFILMTSKSSHLDAQDSLNGRKIIFSVGGTLNMIKGKLNDAGSQGFKAIPLTTNYGASAFVSLEIKLNKWLYLETGLRDINWTIRTRGISKAVFDTNGNLLGVKTYYDEIKLVGIQAPFLVEGIFRPFNRFTGSISLGCAPCFIGNSIATHRYSEMVNIYPNPDVKTETSLYNNNDLFGSFLFAGKIRYHITTNFFLHFGFVYNFTMLNYDRQYLFEGDDLEYTLNPKLFSFDFGISICCSNKKKSIEPK